MGVRKCRVCGCTDEYGCPGGCYWVEADLCSECVDQATLEEDEPVGIDQEEELHTTDFDLLPEMDELCCEVCGSPLDWVDCWNCGGEGYRDVYEEDPLWYDPGDVAACDVCFGRGGFLECPFAENHAEMVAEARGPVYFWLWQRAEWVRIRGRLVVCKLRWRVKERVNQQRAKLQLWGDRASWIGWRGIMKPVEICPDCGKANRVLWWEMGDHWKCLPF